jgi:Ran GTPase-activating protein (RanGAP) involved in mRNA processing and transport
LDLSGNNEHESQSTDFTRPIASALKTNTSITELSLSGNKLNAEAASIFSDAIPDMGSLASLTISGNNIGNEQIAKIKEICAGKSIKFYY